MFLISKLHNLLMLRIAQWVRQCHIRSLSVSFNEFIGYQQRIAAFLQSPAAYPFSSKFFAETVVNTIVQDLASQA